MAPYLFKIFNKVTLAQATLLKTALHVITLWIIET